MVAEVAQIFHSRIVWFLNISTEKDIAIRLWHEMLAWSHIFYYAFNPDLKACMKYHQDYCKVLLEFVDNQWGELTMCLLLYIYYGYLMGIDTTFQSIYKYKVKDNGVNRIKSS